MKTKNWEDLTFADNFMFCMILEHNPDICRKLLELLLHIKIEKLEVPEAERTLQQDYDSKSVRFDVYTKDENRIFDLEEAVHDMAARLLTKKKKLPAKKALLKAPAEHVSRLHGSCLQNKSRWRPYSSAPAFQKKILKKSTKTHLISAVAIVNLFLFNGLQLFNFAVQSVS